MAGLLRLRWLLAAAGLLGAVGGRRLVQRCCTVDHRGATDKLGALLGFIYFLAPPTLGKFWFVEMLLWAPTLSW